MKRFLPILFLLLTATASGAYWLRVSASYNQDNTASTDFARQRVFIQFNNQTVANYVLINNAKSASFDSTFVVDSLGWYSGRIITINNNGDSLQEDFYRSSFYGTTPANVVSIGNDVITAASIQANAIGESELAANSITSSEIADNSIDAGSIAANAIGASEIADDAIDAGAIAANAIGASEVASGAIVNGTEATGFSSFDPTATGVFLTAGGTENDTSFTNLQTRLNAIKLKTDKLIFGADDSLIIDYGNIPSVSLSAEDIDAIIAGILDAGIQIDTAAFRANLAATPLIAGTVNDKTGYSLSASQTFSTTGSVGSVTGNVGGNLVGNVLGTLASLAAAAQHEVALASDSGNTPVATVDYDLAAQIIYDYFVEGSREDPFKGGSGAGPDTTTIVVLSDSDSSAIVGAAVSYYVGADKLATRTDSLGQAIFGATAGSYTAIVESKPRYAATQTITAGTRDTIFMTSVTVVEALDTNLCRVQGYLYNLNGDPVAGAIVTAENQKRDIQIGNTIISHYAVADTTDVGGYWFLDLYPSVTLGDSTYKYTFRLFRTGQSIISKQNIVVPDSASWQFTW